MAEKKLKKTKQIKKVNKSWYVIGITVFLFVAGLMAVYFYIVRNYTVTTIYVEGNIHYTNEEIINMVMEGHYGNNSLLLSLKYKDKSIVGVPFVEKMDVSILNPNTIKIEVYEKALAGYVEYLDRYMYFDKDGIVVESSEEKTSGVPMVTGLKFDHVILYEPLPVDDPSVFALVLNITQLVDKYDLTVDRIYFASDGSLTLYFENIRAALGTKEYLDEKIMHLRYMLPSLAGKSGTIRLENYSEESKNTSFELD